MDRPKLSSTLARYTQTRYDAIVRPTSHTRLRTRDHYASSTLIGGKGGAGPSSLHTMLEGPTEYVNARWMSSLHGFMHGIEWIMFHGHLDYFQKLSLGGRLITKPGDHGTMNPHNRWYSMFYHVRGPAWIEIDWNSIWLRSHMISHYTWGSVTTLHDFGDVLGRPLDKFFWAHNFMVTTPGLCVKWPLGEPWEFDLSSCNNLLNDHAQILCTEAS